MNKLLSFLVLFISLQAAAQMSAHNGAPKYVPKNGEKLLIIGQDLGAAGGLQSHNNGYIDNLSQLPAGVTTYTGIAGLAGLKSQTNWGAGDVNAQAYLDDPAFDNVVISIGLYINNQLNNIINGSRDGDINTLGEWIIESERPVFLRIGYEFDGSWNGLDPDDYKEAWIHIVKKFDELNVKNVAYVWQSVGISTPNIDKWYPGDEFVNWVGYSHFDQPNAGQGMIDFANEHNKPIMIAEAASKKDLKIGDGNDHWNNWYSPLFDRIDSNEKIKALAYINVNWDAQSMWAGQGWGDSRVEVNEIVKANWLNEVGAEDWLLSSTELFNDLQYQLWQDSVVDVIGALHEIVETKKKIKIVSNGSNVIITSTTNEPIKNVKIYSLMGRQLINLENINARTYSVDFEIIKTELVIIHVYLGDTYVRERVVFKNN